MAQMCVDVVVPWTHEPVVHVERIALRGGRCGVPSQIDKCTKTFRNQTLASLCHNYW